MELLIILIICAVIFGFIGMAIGDLGGKKNGAAGFALGALLGPLGCVIAAVIPASDADGAPAVATPDQGTRRKIAALEAQLAELKKPAAKAPAKRADDDGTIPTYSLD
jgi:hypothetical protein